MSADPRLDFPTTYYAPPERADLATIQADRLIFEQDALLQEVLASFPEIYLILNEQRQIVFCNPALLELLGYAQLDFVLGMRPGEALLCQHSSEMAGGCGTTEFCRECGAVRAIITSLRGYDNMQECRILRADGAALDLRVRARPLQLGERQYVLFAVTDIGHEKRRRALESIFFHDILNTASGMVGIGEILQSGSNEDISEFKDLVLTLALSLVDEIKAQQMLVAAEAGELAVHRAPIESIPLLENICAAYRTHKVCERRAITLQPHAQDFTFTSDPTLVRRVLGNMVKNALESTPLGGTIGVGCHLLGENWVEFAVHNPAVMPREVQLQVFNRSFSTKGANRGLGTYSMKLLSERYLHGSVRFTSAAPEGTTFYARYPRT